MKFLYSFFAMLAFATAIHAAPTTEESLEATDCRSPLTVFEENPEDARAMFENQYKTRYEGAAEDFKKFLQLLEANSISPQEPAHLTFVKNLTAQIARFYAQIDMGKVLTQLEPFFYPEQPEQTLKAFSELVKPHLWVHAHIQAAMREAHKWEEGTHGTRLAKHLEGLFVQPKQSTPSGSHLQPGGTGFCGW